MTEVPIVFLTALDVEYLAVRARMTALGAHRHRAGTRYEIGLLPDGETQAALGLTGVGNQSAAALAERAIAEFSPAAVFFVGVAGALWGHVMLGDVVVANRVYAYHGATSQDDGLKARPRAWEMAHEAEQLAHRLVRGGGWTRSLPPGGAVPVARIGPIAAGEVVQDSAISDQARWIRDVYNDALAVEMEAAGVAQAGHVNRSLPVVVVRGISDRADGTKGTTDGAGWQSRAATNAAAFATTFAELLARELPGGAAGPDRHRSGDTTTNIAQGNAHVSIQAGRIEGPVVLDGPPPTYDLPVDRRASRSADLVDGLHELRQLLHRAWAAGGLDEDTYAAAMRELDLASDPGERPAVVLSLMRLRGLLMDVADLAGKVKALLVIARTMP
ncbi:5'-methylthioadenosine/S-adenosylhomocysteine nucleosidase family protein [Phytohabitans sp. LJ34]|uniref:5'-methylthioadenosine/S-adenosylhomocysteine nucleosidase family protein n=1 Tax=Phytohabitans sp. LJ34 TaxID=3452217 RepID=UPI003F8B2EC8